MSVPAPLYVTDVNGWLTYYNEAAAVLWGRRPEIGKDRWCGSWRIYQLDGTRLPHDQCGMAVVLTEGRAVGEAHVVSSGQTARGCRSWLIRPRFGILQA